ncbi:hypothetical protein RF11_02434 [Thelohanellus kitauei]|uniref:Uncharacterized protein n=1 Tax=Thelohanellus kitauei TaxID=669202 RepID=A0A0C2MRC2_THEKT|nr:hypothetical protein RF11_02434 [Thelohanellus kitauei]
MRKFTPDTLVKPPWMKRVIQTNPEIGKMLGNVPAVVAKSFDMFFYDLMAELTAEATGGSQITPSLIKSFVDKHDKYKFLGEVVNDTVEMIQANRRGVKKASQRSTLIAVGVKSLVWMRMRMELIPIRRV